MFASTGGAIYGECERPATEEDPPRPLAPYGAAKLCAEEYLATFERLYGGGNVVLRLGNVYGPRQDPHGEAGVVAIFLGLLAEGGTPKIFGDGSQTRDYVYVGDVVRAALAAQNGPAGRVQRRHRSRDVGGRAAREVLQRRRCGHRTGVRAQRGPASSSAASSIRR